MVKSGAFVCMALLCCLGLLLSSVNAQCTSSFLKVASTATCVVCPATYQVSTMPGAPNVTLPLVVSPGGSTGNYTTESGLIRIDIMLLYDTTGSSQNDRSLLKNEMDNFFAYFGAANGYTDARVAVASCRSTSTTFTYTRYASLTSNTNTLQSAIDAIVVNNNEQNVPVWGPNCISRGMVDANVGWRSNSFRVVAFLSGNAMFTTYNLSPDILSTNVVPLFYLPTASADTIASTKAYAATLPVAFINYGSTNDNSKKYQGWSLDVYKAVNGTTNTIYFGRTSDLAVYDTFIRSIPGNVTLPFGQIVNGTFLWG